MKNLLFITLIIGLLSSCSRVYYFPNSQNVPLFTESDELQISAKLGATENNSTFELQSAYSIDSVWAVQLNLLSSDITNSRTAGFNFEAAVGRYKKLDKNWSAEIYMGVGAGNLKWDSHPGEVKFSSTKLYLQPNFGYAGRTFEVAISLKVGYNYMFNRGISNINSYLDSVYADSGFDPLYQSPYQDIRLPTNYSFFTIEPAFTVRFGFESFKFQTQLVLSDGTGMDESTFLFLRDNINFNVGFIMQLNN